MALAEEWPEAVGRTYPALEPGGHQMRLATGAGSNPRPRLPVVGSKASRKAGIEAEQNRQEPVEPEATVEDFVGHRTAAARDRPEAWQPAGAGHKKEQDWRPENMADQPQAASLARSRIAPVRLAQRAGHTWIEWVAPEEAGRTLADRPSGRLADTAEPGAA